MNALVTGGAGFIGASLVQALLERGSSVRVLDNLVVGSKANVPSNVEFLEGDIRDTDILLEATEGVDVVFHQAAFKSVPRSIEDPLSTETSNAIGTLNVLMAAERMRVKRLVYASSSSVYGDIPDTLKKEESTLNPISPYGVSKLAGEMYSRVWSSLDRLPTVSLRYFNVFGPGQRAEGPYAAVFPSFILSLLDGSPPKIFGDGDQSRDFTFVEDVVRANLRAAEAAEEVEGRVFNICSGAPKTVNEVLKAVSESLGKWVDPQFMPARAGDIRHSNGDISAARHTLGWEPKAPWKESVDKTVEWFASQ